MLLAAIAVIGLTALAAVAIAGRHDGVFASTQPARVTRSNSLVDEAERILAQRYAKGEITPDEYNRMLAILRR
jgi:uncharacterized membrane protein